MIFFNHLPFIKHNLSRHLNISIICSRRFGSNHIQQISFYLFSLRKYRLLRRLRHRSHHSIFIHSLYTCKNHISMMFQCSFIHCLIHLHINIVIRITKGNIVTFDYFYSTITSHPQSCIVFMDYFDTVVILCIFITHLRTFIRATIIH